MNHAALPTGIQASDAPVIAVVVKGYPRLSETFIAQEFKALESRGYRLLIFSLRYPTDHTIHPIHREIHADVHYLPEYLYQNPLRVLRGFWHGLRRKGFGRALRTWLRDLRRDPNPNRVRRFGQALVMANEFPREIHRIYAHFMHTPGSVARYTAMLLDLPWGFSAHAKDIWTIPEWEKREKLADCAFAVTCTEANVQHLRSLAPTQRVQRVYHGLDFERFPDPGPRSSDQADGVNGVVELLSVGRAVKKKGYPILLQALSCLSADVRWRLTHIGGGGETENLRRLAQRLGVDERIRWLGALDQARVLEAYREAHIFVLASIITGDGDRDGLPNVLMEAQSQRLCCVATRVSGIPELIEHGRTGLLAEPGNAEDLCRQLTTAIRSPELRNALADAGWSNLRQNFAQEEEIDVLIQQLERM